MFKNLYKACISALILMLLVSACASANPAQEQRLGDLESKVNTLSSLQTALTSLQDEVTAMKMEHTNDADLQTRLDGLQTRVDELAAQVEMTHSETASADTTAPAEHTDDPFAVSVAQYFMDTAGFHGIAETISETQTVDPAYLSTVNRVHKVLAATTWPETLSEQGHTFTTLLEEFAAALEADDAVQATGLADQVHDAQHELSHAIDAWLGSIATDAMASTEHSDDPFAVSVAQYFMDTAGFHGIAETISETQTVDPAYLGTVNRVHKVLMATTWPEALSEQGHAFTALLEEFAAALEADDAVQATELADQVHDAQHELSHAIDAWLGTAVDAHTH